MYTQRTFYCSNWQDEQMYHLVRMCHFCLSPYRSGTEEDLTEKLTLLQEISDKEEEGKRLVRKRKEEQAAAEKVRTAQQEKVDACLTVFRAGTCVCMWIHITKTM